MAQKSAEGVVRAVAAASIITRASGLCRRLRRRAIRKARDLDIRGLAARYASGSKARSQMVEIGIGNSAHGDALEFFQRAEEFSTACDGSVSFAAFRVSPALPAEIPDQ